jgi:hypothetical protein
VPLVSLAAWQALVDRARVRPGQKVLVHAGSGGLGSTVIQLAKHLGATVATTARGENAELVRSLGADVVVDYRQEDFAEVLSGYDVVLDSLGGEDLERSLTVLKPGGQAISVTGPPDPAFAKQLGAPKLMGVVIGLLSRKVRKQAPRLGVSYSFLFMQANRGQLRERAHSTTRATSARSSTRRSRSTRPSRRWRTSTRAAPTARSSSRSTDNAACCPTPAMARKRKRIGGSRRRAARLCSIRECVAPARPSSPCLTRRRSLAPLAV